MTLFVVTPSYAQGKVNFGTGLALLFPPEGGLFFQGRVTLDGQFVVGAGISDTIVQQGTHLYLWNLRKIDRNGKAIKAAPLKSFDMSAYADSVFGQSHMAFSPDSRRLAIFANQNILLISIPEFELLATIPVKGLDSRHDRAVGSIAWSHDGHLLAVDHDLGLMVWEEPKVIISPTNSRNIPYAYPILWMVGCLITSPPLRFVRHSSNLAKAMKLP